MVVSHSLTALQVCTHTCTHTHAHRHPEYIPLTLTHPYSPLHHLLTHSPLAPSSYLLSVNQGIPGNPARPLGPLQKALQKHESDVGDRGWLDYQRPRTGGPRSRPSDTATSQRVASEAGAKAWTGNEVLFCPELSPGLLSHRRDTEWRLKI